MPRTIVVGYDGSDHGNDALALGRLLARMTDAGLVVACAYPEDPLGKSAAAHEVDEGLREDAERLLARAREWLAGTGDAGDGGLDGRVDLRAVAGASPSHVLHDLAEQLSAEAIVVGPTHHGRALRLLTGSTPEAVLDHAPCPVAVAPDGFRDAGAAAGAAGGGDAGPGGAGAPVKIAVAFDGSAESEHALAIAAGFARAASARLRIVMVVNSAAVGVYPPLDVSAYEEIAQLAREEARRRLDAAIAGLEADGVLGGVMVEGVVLDGDAHTALVDDSSTEDLLFTGSRGQGPWRRVLLGSISTHLLRDAKCPVVIVPRGSGEPV